MFCVSVENRIDLEINEKKTICSRIRWRDPSVFFFFCSKWHNTFFVHIVYECDIISYYFLVNVTISWLFAHQLCCPELAHTLYDFQYVTCSIHWLTVDVNHKLILLHMHRHRRLSRSDFFFRMNILFSSAYSTCGIYKWIGITHRQTFLVFCTNKIDLQ